MSESLRAECTRRACAALAIAVLGAIGGADAARPPHADVLARDVLPPRVTRVLPASGTVLNTVRPAILADYEDVGVPESSSGIDAAATQLFLDGNDVTESAEVTTDGLRFTPSAALAAGSHEFEILVRDHAGNVSRVASRFDVHPPPSAPALEIFGERSVRVGETLRLDLFANDPNGDPVVYSAATLPLPENASLDAETGVFSFTPSSDQIGKIELTFVASDGVRTGARSVGLSVTEGEGRDSAASPRAARADGARILPRVDSVVAGESGAVTLDHFAARYRSEHRARSLRLVYGSDLADPRPILASVVRVPGNPPPVLATRLTLGGVRMHPTFTRTEDLARDAEESILRAVQIDASWLATGSYPYELALEEHDGGISHSVHGEVFVHNERASPWGTGWSLAGHSRSVERSDGGRVIVHGDELSFVEGAGPGTLELGDGTRVDFDATGRHTRTVDANGVAVRFEYDEAGRLIHIVDSLGLTTSIRYDERGRVERLVDPEGGVTSLEHDVRGDLSRIVDPDGAEREFEYDDRHRVISERFRERTTRYEYDFAGRVARVDGPEGVTFPAGSYAEIGLLDPASGFGTEDRPAPFVRVGERGAPESESRHERPSRGAERPDPATFSPPFPRLAMVSLTSTIAPEYRPRLARYDLLILGKNMPGAIVEEMRTLGDPFVSVIYFGSYYKTTASENDWAEDPVLTIDANNWWLRDPYPDGDIVSDWPITSFVNLTAGVQAGPDGYYTDWFPSWYRETYLEPGVDLQVDGIFYDNVFWNIHHQLYVFCENAGPCTALPPPCTCGPADFDADGISDTDPGFVNDLFNAGMLNLLEDTRALFGKSAWILGNGDGLGNYAHIQNGSALEKFAQIYGKNDYGNPFGYNYRWEYNMFGPERGLHESKHRHYHRRMNPGFVSWNAGWSLGNPQHTYGTPDRTVEFERDKRFKLASTLMTDAYFLLRQWATTTLWWEDEYANGGTEEGYLGYPEDEFQRLLSVNGPNHLPNGDFASGFDSWEVIAAGGVQVTSEILPGADPNGNDAAHFTVSGSVGANWNAQLRQRDTYSVAKDQPYTLSLWARADPARDVKIEMMTDGGALVSPIGKLLGVETEWREFVISFIAADSVLADGELRLSFGDYDGEAWFSDVRIQDGHTYFFRRDFGKGAAWVNATPDPHTVLLTTPMHKLTGSINPDYDGSEVDSFVIPPYDGLILVKRAQDVDVDAPTVAVTSPQPNSLILDPSIPVVAEVTDASPIFRVVFYVDDVAAGVAFEPPYSFDLERAEWGAGLHALKAIAIDSAGNETESPAITVELRKKPRGGKHPPAILVDPDS